MLLVRRLFPQRPTLAWLTGLGLAVNHVWCRMAPFVLTDNLFYLLLFALLCSWHFSWNRSPGAELWLLVLFGGFYS